MVDVNAFKQIFSLQSAAWTAVALIILFVVRMWNGAPAMLETWIHWKQAKAAEKVADWSRLREEINRLSEAEKQCRADYQELHAQHMDLHSKCHELNRRVAELEGYYVGQGKASQEAAGIVALERMKKDKKE